MPENFDIVLRFDQILVLTATNCIIKLGCFERVAEITPLLILYNALQRRFNTTGPGCRVNVEQSQLFAWNQ